MKKYIAIIGIILSLYLVFLHNSSGGSVCDASELFSCSTANNSEYSTLLNIPVAYLGMIWFIGLLYFEQFKKNKNVEKIWSYFGLVGVLYFIYAEISLGVICIACSLVHLLILVVFYINFKDMVFKITWPKEFYQEILLFSLLITSLIVMHNGDNVNHDNLALCLSDKGYTMFSSYTCGYCQKNKNLFGKSFSLINHIECNKNHPENQRELCQEYDVVSTPTWIRIVDGEEIWRKVGLTTPKDLKEISGC